MIMMMHVQAGWSDAGAKHADAAGCMEIIEDTIDAASAAHKYGDVALCTCLLRRLSQAAPEVAGRKSRTPAVLNLFSAQFEVYTVLQTKISLQLLSYLFCSSKQLRTQMM